MVTDLSGWSAGSLVETIYNNAWVRGVLALILADVLSGVGLALYSKEYRLAQTADFLVTRAVPYLLGGGTMQLVVKAAPSEWGIVTDVASGAVWATVILALAGHFLDNLKQMGLPVPTFMTSRPAQETKPTT